MWLFHTRFMTPCLVPKHCLRPLLMPGTLTVPSDNSSFLHFQVSSDLMVQTQALSSGTSTAGLLIVWTHFREMSLITNLRYLPLFLMIACLGYIYSFPKLSCFQGMCFLCSRLLSQHLFTQTVNSFHDLHILCSLLWPQLLLTNAAEPPCFPVNLC